MPSGGTPKIYDAQLVSDVTRLYARGYTQVEVARTLHTTQKIVWNLMRRHNIKARTAAKRDQQGNQNHMWKGSEASYKAKHQRVATARGRPMKCSVCQTDDPARSYDWANVNGDYDDIEGYVRMCRSCHWKHDGTINNLRKGGSPR